MAAKKYPFQPDYAVPPGATLREALDERGLSQSDLAQRTGMAEKTISQIVNGIAPLTFETAEKLEMALSIPARFWNTHELAYREALARIEAQERLAADAEWLTQIPVKVLVERGYVEANDDKGAMVRSILKFFGVSDVSSWNATWLAPCAHYRGQEVQKRHPGRVAAWIRMGEIKAAQVQLGVEYGARKFKNILLEIRKLTVKPAATWVFEIKRLCAEAGVVVVFVPEIPGASVSGVAKWIKDTPVIMISLKYKTDDQFWFTFFHEAGHILLHSKKQVFIDDGQLSGEFEDDANAFARDLLIPQEFTREFAYLKSRVAIREFASRVGIAAGVLVGRLQRERILQPAFCNDLKVRLEWDKGEGNK